MTPKPGDGLDLDALTAEAIHRGSPNISLTDAAKERHSPLSLLVCVAINNRLDLAERLLAAGATMNTGELAHAIWWRSSGDIVRLFRNHGVPSNESCLTAALRHRHWDAVFALLECGTDVQTEITYAQLGTASPSFRQGGKTSLLHLAAWMGDFEATRRLLESGVDVNLCDSEGLSPLMKVCEKSSSDENELVEIVDLLLQSGADADALTPNNESPLLLCLAHRPKKDTQIRDRIIELLLNDGADPNVVSPADTTPLMLVARDDNVELINKLMQCGADPTAKMPDGKTALDIAVKYGSRNAERILGSL